MEGVRFPPQSQEGRATGIESEMTPQPKFKGKLYKGSNKLKGKVALITGGDSGIGRSVAVLFAREGAKVAINYLPQEQNDAEKTKQAVEQEGGYCYLLPGDISSSRYCHELIEKTVYHFGRLDILINNAAWQRVQTNFLDIGEEQLERTFRVNVYSIFYLCRSALRHMKSGSCIINTTSVAAFKGNPELIDYAASQAAVEAFTRALSIQLAHHGIRVNAVAAGDTWTPIIPSSYPAQLVPGFGHRCPMNRAAMPEEIAPSFVYLASDESSYVSGQTMHPNGGIVVNG